MKLTLHLPPAVLSAALASVLLSGCNLNSLLSTEPEPAPLPSVEPPPAPVLTEDELRPQPAQPSAIQHAPQGTALDLQGADIRGTQTPALEDEGQPQAAESNEVFLGAIAAPAQGAEPEILTAAPRPHSAGDLLPTYATGSNLGGSCDFAQGPAAQSLAQSMTAALASKLKIEPGMVYAAPTIVPDAYLDCISDLSPAINAALQSSDLLQTVSAQDKTAIEQGVSQNAGTSATLPLTIRTLRSHQIPYLIVSTVRRLSSGPALSIRFVRVSDGITLTQSFQKLPESAPAQTAAETAEGAL